MHLVTLAQHEAVAAHVLDQGELVVRAPDDAHDLDATRVGRRIATDVGTDELAVHQRLERIAPTERVVLVGDVIVEMRARKRRTRRDRPGRS